MEQKYFYIVGLPRSRTTWLSHLFTTDFSYCFHELLSSYGNYAGAMQRTFKPFVGSSDTNPVSFLMLPKPNGPVVVIERDKDEAINSFLKWFNPVAAFGGDYANTVKRLFSFYLEAMDKIKPHALVVEYNDLNNNDVVECIWNYCIPGIVFDKARGMLFQDTVITVKNKDLTRSIKHSAHNLNLKYEDFCKYLMEGKRPWQQQQ